MAIKLNIGKPKEPTKSLAEQLKTTAVSGQSSLSIKTNPIVPALEKKSRATAHTEDVNKALATLTKPLAEPTGVMQGIANQIATSSTIPTVTAEKYSLLAEASDILDQKTIDQFNQRMQYLEVAFDNDELPDAMKRVLEYCQEHQELRPFLRAEDIAIFVRGARKSYARVAEKKSTNRAKKSKSAIMDDNIMESLMDLDIDL